MNSAFKSVVPNLLAGRRHLWARFSLGWPLLGSSTAGSQPPRRSLLTQEDHDKGFVDAKTPYQKPDRQCILCRHKIALDYKNVRLLSQFVSPLTGDVYDKHITGLCELQQTILEREIKKSRRAMFMPWHYRHPRYNSDPPLFNPERPQRPNPY